MKDGKNWSGEIGRRQIARRQKIKKEAQEPDKDAGKVSGSETKRLKNKMEQVY
jgi:hypothetical protein